jgi:hypothetical protein
MQSSGTGLFPNELFIALPYILTIVLTVSEVVQCPSEAGSTVRRKVARQARLLVLQRHGENRRTVVRVASSQVDWSETAVVG